ncbi:MAG: GGDEF domain-containing protein [Geminicoccaceae bacterium]|nr:MAG: GGDEF domain-containing protein [Geminicoccaceae bacterium]
MHTVHRCSIAKLYGLVVLSVCMVALSFYTLGLRPLERHIRATHEATLAADLEHARWQFDALIEQHHDIARQAASRTAIRNAQIAHLGGRLSAIELVAFATAKLADAVNANHHVLGVHRFAPDGTALLAVGRPPAVAAIEACARHLGQDVLTLPVRRGAHGLVFLYCSPIDDPMFGRVGFDVLTLSDLQVRAFLEANVRPHRLLAVAAERYGIVVAPTAEDAVALRRVLIERVDDVVGPHGDGAGEITRTGTAVPELGLYAVVEQQAFFQPIEAMFRRLAVVLAPVGLAILGLSLWAVRPLVVALLREEQLERRTRTDGLTGLANREHVTARIDRAWQRPAPAVPGFAVVLIDIDHFKRVNDVHGHAAGDAALRSMARLCRFVARESDCWARFGGEEFLAYLPATDALGAAKVAERLRHVVAATPIELPDGAVIGLTVSAGVACSRDAGTTDGLIAAADRALYASKRTGRNRVTIDRPSPAQPPVARPSRRLVLQH